MKLHETLKSLRNQKGMSQMAVVEYLHENGVECQRPALSKWETGATQPNLEQFLLLCKLYGARDVLAAFYGLPARNAYSELNERGVEKAKEYISLLAGSEKYGKMRKSQESKLTRTIPLYDIPVSAGTGMFLDSDQYELIEVDDPVPSIATFAVTISGDSMEPEFEDRQIIYIRQQPTIEPGEVGIFMLNGDVYCKQALNGSLVSFNPKYKPIRIRENDDFRIIGKVVG